uniref:Photosystem II protein M n=1 Tax=Cuscuta strobilacea TaxID=437305 RepID=A0A4Y5N1C4_9ASTE|nr:photosystem II protein M [Cuscuta strobilacea]QCW07830.1 photosystem II protein M [Cuscuta strobilacea]
MKINILAFGATAPLILFPTALLLNSLCKNN